MFSVHKLKIAFNFPIINQDNIKIVCQHLFPTKILVNITNLIKCERQLCLQTLNKKIGRKWKNVIFTIIHNI